MATARTIERPGRAVISIILGLLIAPLLLSRPATANDHPPNPFVVDGLLTRSCAEATSIHKPLEGRCNWTGHLGFAGTAIRTDPDVAAECQDACDDCCEAYGGVVGAQHWATSVACDCAVKTILQGGDIRRGLATCLPPVLLENYRESRRLSRKEKGALASLLDAAEWPPEMVHRFIEWFQVPIVGGDGDWRIHRRFRPGPNDERREELDTADALVQSWGSDLASSILEGLFDGLELCKDVSDALNAPADAALKHLCKRDCARRFTPTPKPDQPTKPKDGSAGKQPADSGAGRGDEPPPPPEPPEPDPRDEDPCQGLEGETCFDGFADPGSDCIWLVKGDTCDCDCVNVSTDHGDWGPVDCARCDPADRFITKLPAWCDQCD